MFNILANTQKPLFLIFFFCFLILNEKAKTTNYKLFIQSLIFELKNKNFKRNKWKRNKIYLKTTS